MTDNEKTPMTVKVEVYLKDSNASSEYASVFPVINITSGVPESIVPYAEQKRLVEKLRSYMQRWLNNSTQVRRLTEERKRLHCARKITVLFLLLSLLLLLASMVCLFLSAHT